MVASGCGSADACHPLASGSGGESGDGNVLLIGDDLARIDRLVPTIRRVTFSPPRADGAGGCQAGTSERLRSRRGRAAAAIGAGGAAGDPCRGLPVPADRGAGDRATRAGDPTAPRGWARRPTGCCRLPARPRTFRARSSSSCALRLAWRCAAPPGFIWTRRAPCREEPLHHRHAPHGQRSTRRGQRFRIQLLVASLNTPIRGQARVVRHAGGRKAGEHGIAVTFVCSGARAPSSWRAWSSRSARPPAPRSGGPNALPRGAA